MKKPSILVEALAVRNDSGLGRLARMLLEGLRGLTKTAEVHVVIPASDKFRPAPELHPILVEPKPLRLWVQAGFPLLIRKVRPDIVLCLGQTLPMWRRGCRFVVMVPDAGPLEDLGWPTSSHDAYNRKWLTSMPSRADLCLTISDFAKERLVKLLGMPHDRIRVIRPIHPHWFGRPDETRRNPEDGHKHAHDSHKHGSADTAAQEDNSEIATSESQRIPEGDFFLSIGNVEPRKNFPGLIAAYAGLKKRHPDAPPLYIAGHKAWGIAAAEAAVVRFGLQDSVKFTDYLSEANRKAFLRECTVFIASSLYEGWGLPLFEALAQGKPAIYHRESSQEEFAKGLAMAVDCSDAAQLGNAMERLWLDAGAREKYQTALKKGFDKILEYDMEGALRQALLPLLTA